MSDHELLEQPLFGNELLQTNDVCIYFKSWTQCDILYVKDIINDNPMSKFILLGDLNYDIYDPRHEMSEVLRDFLKDYGLLSSHELDASFNHGSSFTRCCLKGGTFSLLDYIFFSRSLRDRVSDCAIIYDGANPSDHFPVQLKLEVEPQHPGNTASSFDSHPGKINWSALDEDDLSTYRDAMDALLSGIQVPVEILHGNKQCSISSHHSIIDHYLQTVVDAVATADSFLPIKSPKGKGGKHFWSDSLEKLKKDSVESYSEWQIAGRPSSGPFFERKKSCHFTYKAELRRQRRHCALAESEVLSQKLIQKDYFSFWKDWRKASQIRSPLVNRIGDSVSEPEISNTFKSFFQQIYGCDDTDAHNALRMDFQEKFPHYYALKKDDSISPFLLTWDDMTAITGKLKVGKCYNSFITAEYILYGSPKLIAHLHLLFNSFMQHGFVPSHFLLGTITPIVKDSRGDINSVDNYRGITLCGVFSHMFENALRRKFGHFIVSDDLQFGFKPKHSTNHAMFTLKTCVNHFTKRDSNVYVAFLDYSKAFDTISHSGLFLKLMEKNVPLCFLLVIIFWYVNMHYECRWGKSCSGRFPVKCGTKQGGILSPDFFSLYINDLIRILRQMAIGCHILNYFLACILFADDMTLLAPTRDAMQRLLNACADYCGKYCLKFNVAKTKIMVFGKISAHTNSLSPLFLRDSSIEYVASCKYLGFHVKSGRHFKIYAHEGLCGFFGSVNSIMSSITCPQEDVQMQLLYSNCVPKLTYGAAVKELTAAEKQQYSVALNNAVRRIFGFRRWESIRYIREFYKHASIEMLFAKARTRFERSLTSHSNHVLRFLSRFIPSSVDVI